MSEKKYFNLFSCCVPIRGYKRVVICDLQRDCIHSIPFALHEILIHFVLKGISILEIKLFWENKNNEIIDEYFNYLERIECGFFSNKYQNLPKIDVNNYYEPKTITNAIVDVQESSCHDFHKIINELSDLKCEALELRFFMSIDIMKLQHILDIMTHSTLRCIEVLICFENSFSIEKILNLKREYPRIRKMTIYNSEYDKIFNYDEELYIIYTKHKLDADMEQSCGVVSPWYFISKTENFIEAKHFNSCLNRKIAIDRNGEIKNCPSMNISYGNISNTSLIDIVNLPDFAKLWKITKDQIAVCQDCEFRYVCQDCRAFTLDNNLYAKPKKCTYNPYV